MSKHKNGIVTETVNISPEWAQEALDELERRVASGKFRQRPIREGAIKRYAQDMRKGKWRVTHQGIAFDTEGNLIDGQNRLRAIVMAGVKVGMRVTLNVPNEKSGPDDVTAMDTIDLGVPRNMWQALQISHGYGGEAVELSAIARGIASFCIGNPNRAGRKLSRSGMSPAQCLQILEKLDYVQSAERLIATVPVKKLRPAGFSSVWCWYHKVHPRKAESFATDFVELANLGHGHPAMVLFRYLTMRNLRARKKDLDLMSMVANALQAYHQGETIGTLRGNDEAYLWMLKLNWANVEIITDLMIGEKALTEIPSGVAIAKAA